MAKRPGQLPGAQESGDRLRTHGLLHEVPAALALDPEGPVAGVLPVEASKDRPVHLEEMIEREVEAPDREQRVTVHRSV